MHFIHTWHVGSNKLTAIHSNANIYYKQWGISVKLFMWITQNHPCHNSRAKGVQIVIPSEVEGSQVSS